MKCFKEQKLWEYLDNEVSDIEKSNIETHLHICSKCQEQLEELNFFDSEFADIIHSDFQYSNENEVNITEIELDTEERKVQLRKCWKKIGLFGLAVVLATSLLFVFACPISNYHIYEAGFHQITYGISQFLVLMLTPVLMSIWVIILTFGILFKMDKVWQNWYEQV